MIIMRGILSNALLLIIAVVVVVAAYPAKDDYYSQMNSNNNLTTYGCVGLHCLDDDTYMDHHERRSRILSQTPSSHVSGTSNPNQQAIACPNAQRYTTSCLGSGSGQCRADSQNRADEIYCK